MSHYVGGYKLKFVHRGVGKLSGVCLTAKWILSRSLWPKEDGKARLQKKSFSRFGIKTLKNWNVD